MPFTTDLPKELVHPDFNEKRHKLQRIQDILAGRCRICVGKSNPTERARLNAVNSRLMSSLGEVRLMVDPNRAPMVAEDFNSVCLLEGGSGEPDKDAKRKYMHWTDGLGYYIADRYPIAGPRESISVGGFS